MGQIIRYNGIIIYYYPGDHNPRHLHVYAGDEEVRLVNDLIDQNMDAINEEIEKEIKERECL